MTLSSTIQCFFDRHAKYFSKKEFLLDWMTDVTGAKDRPVLKVDLCTGTTFKEVLDELLDDGWESHIEEFDTHWILQVILAETKHHPQQTVLIERIKGTRDPWLAPHSAIPIPADRIIQLDTSAISDEAIDCACVLEHGSQASDVIQDLQVEETLEFEGGTSLHEFVATLQRSLHHHRREIELQYVGTVPCEVLSRTLAIETMQALGHCKVHGRT